MVRRNVAMVFSTNCDDADAIITQIRQQFDIELLHVEISYGKLWIQKGDPPEDNHDKN